MGAIIRNGIDYSGLINASGVFIDTSKVIKANTTFRNSMSYTATEDCVFVSYTLLNGDITIKIDNKWVGGAYAGSTVGFPITLFLKKGQTISISGVNASYDSSYTIYGVIQGTSIEDEPRYMGSQLLLTAGTTTSSSKTGVYCGSKDYILPQISVPDGYKIKVKISATLNTAEGNYAIVSLNNVDLFSVSTWIGGTSSVYYGHYGKTLFSDLLDLDDIPTMSRYFDNTGSGYYNFYIRSDTNNKGAYVNNLTIHYYAVKI